MRKKASAIVEGSVSPEIKSCHVPRSRISPSRTTSLCMVTVVCARCARSVAASRCSRTSSTVWPSLRPGITTVAEPGRGWTSWRSWVDSRKDVVQSEGGWTANRVDCRRTSLGRWTVTLAPSKSCHGKAVVAHCWRNFRRKRNSAQDQVTASSSEACQTVEVRFSIANVRPASGSRSGSTAVVA